MIFTGVLVNAVGIAVMGIIGSFILKSIPDNIGSGLLKAVGLAVLYIGISGALKAQSVMLLVCSMVIGTLIGELIDIDKQMNRFGKWIEEKLEAFGNKKAGRVGDGTAAAVKTVSETEAEGEKAGPSKPGFSQGFVYASILFCVGSMAIVGSMNSGFMCDHTMLFTKTILDATTALILGGTMGIGVAFSALPIILYEGALTLIAAFLGNIMPEIMINEMSAIGSILIIGIGLSFFDIKNIKVANMIPAMFIPCIWIPFSTAVGLG